MRLPSQMADGQMEGGRITDTDTRSTHPSGFENPEQPTPVSPPANRQITVLTIAGFDPSSGAGLSADLKVFAAHGLYGVAAATALTVQSTAGVRRSEPVSAALLAETLACLAEDLPLDGIKIGMLATAHNVDAVARFLESFATREIPIVLDPVLCSSSGHPLLDPAGLERLRTQLLPVICSFQPGVVTPNLDELLLLTGRPPGPSVAEAPAVEEAAFLLAEQFPKLDVVATGGHLARPDDCVVSPGQAPVWLEGEWVHTRATHGTGCGFSSALLCGLVAGLGLLDAARAAKRYVAGALGAAIPMGHGGGSMDHFYAVDLVPGRIGAERAKRPDATNQAASSSYLQQCARPTTASETGE